MNTNTDKDNTPGNVKITNAVVLNAEGKGCNIKNIISSINIYEDIMSPFISGNVVISDAIALAELLPFQGEEMLILELETPGLTDGDSAETDINYKRVFTTHLYKMVSKENAALKKVMYELAFMSLDAVKDMNTKVSRTFRGNASDIAKTLLAEPELLGTNKELLIEPTSNKVAFTANFWTPAKALMFLAEKSLNSNSNPNYLFFENAEGFVFASLDALYQYPPVTEIVRDQQVRSITAGEEHDTERDYSKILDMSSSKQYDYIERCSSGMYGSSIYTFDVETKKLNYKTVDGWRDFGDSRVRLNTNLPSTAPDGVTVLPAPYNPAAKMFVEVSQQNSYNGAPMPMLENNMRRSTLLNQAQFNRISVQVFGRFDYTVGRTIDVIIYADKEVLENDAPEDAYDKVLSGRYLITACNHNITTEAHFCNMELAKDSYAAHAAS